MILKDQTRGNGGDTIGLSMDHVPSMVVRPVVRFAVAWEGSVLLVPVLFEPGHVDASRLGTVVNTTMATSCSIGGDATDRKPDLSNRKNLFLHSGKTTASSPRLSSSYRKFDTLFG